MILQRIFCCTFAVLVFWIREITGTIHLDVKSPLVKTSPGNAGSDRFGFSVSLHQISTPVAGNFQSFVSNARLIVGAPRGTYPGGLNLTAGSEEVNTGLVYQCPLGPEPCSGMLGNGQGYDRRLFDGYGNSDTENKTGQLMGAVVYSQGDYFMACAPLYVVFKPSSIAIDDSRPVGRCFLSGSDLQNFTVIMPCDGTASQEKCLTGFSAALIEQDINNMSLVILGSPGELTDTGQLFYFTPKADGNVTPNGQTSNSFNIFDPIFSLDGSASVTGFITSSDNLDIISGAPRHDGRRLFGSVRVRTQANRHGSTSIELLGSQNGEHFGAAVATADLNNDGYDELIVGAPIYTTTSILEAGRVYVYENLQGSLNFTPIVLEGHSVQSRFGSSIINIGDINGDSYDDVVVGAPYENNTAEGKTSGTIYLYCGKGSEGGLISRSPDLIVTALSVTKRVSDLTMLKGFGFSLSSRDIDGNLFKDLLVGAHLTGNAVVIRSFSMANVSVELTSSVSTVQVDAMGSDSTFDVLVCGTFGGPGLTNRSLNTSLLLKDSSSFSRVLFKQDDSDVDIFNSTFRFSASGEKSCLNVSVLTKPIQDLSQQSDFLSPINVTVMFSELALPSTMYRNGSPEPIVDYRDFPILTVAGDTSIAVQPVVACPIVAGEHRCRPDLTISLSKVLYLDSSGRASNGSAAIAGQFDSLRVELAVNNIGREPSLGAQIRFTLPEGYSFQLAFDNTTNKIINCRTEQSLQRVYNCKLRSYIPPIAQTSEGAPSMSEVHLTWRYVGSPIVGNEPPQASNISIFTSDNETNTDNNLINGSVIISYAAIADFEISTFQFNVTVPQYRREIVPVNPTIMTLGRNIILELRALNRGPSNAPTAILDVFLPTNDSDTTFFIYPYAVTVLQNGKDIRSKCDFSGLNPQNLPSGASTTRNKRSAVRKRQVNTAGAESQISGDEIRDCSDPATRVRGICTRISCILSDFVSSQAVQMGVSAVLDNRFFQDQSAPFVFIAYATIHGNDSFVSDNILSNNEERTDPYKVTLSVVSGPTNLPIWIPILIAIIIVIIFIFLFILLFCIGCYRHNKKQQEREDEDFPQGPKVSLDIEEKFKDDCDVPENEGDGGSTDDIGDASDLQDAEEEEKAEKTDETSL